MSEEVLDSIKQQISENPIILYMKVPHRHHSAGFGANRASA